MSVIQVVAPGLLTTVQDLGREGFGPMGVSPSGAADRIALRLGNRLVGNAEGAAGLEMTLLGGTFLFQEPTGIALMGADFGATLDGVPVELGSSLEAQSGQTLRAGPTRSGARCYLCIQGGIAVTPFLGSASTHLLSGLGGLEGRALRKGDVLNCGPATSEFRKRIVSPLALQHLLPRKVLRVTGGPHDDRWAESLQQLFYANPYRVAEESNRMGLRLDGPGLDGPGLDGRRLGGSPVPARSGGQMITEGIALGAIQVPESGQPIISFVEQQTTGGYPIIANVISADLSSIGQLRPRDAIRFQRVEMNKARSLLIEQEEQLTSEDLILE
jgi:antagonist of KipI